MGEPKAPVEPVREFKVYFHSLPSLLPHTNYAKHYINIMLYNDI